MSVIFARGRLLNSASTDVQLIASGVMSNGGTLPTSFTSGDRIILTAITNHDVAANKTVTSTPSGFVLQASKTSDDYIPDLHVYMKTAELVDRGRAVSFGANVHQIAYVVARGGGNLFFGANDYSYFNTSNVAAVAKTGLHVMPVAMSQSTASIGTGPGATWVLRGDGTTGSPDYGAGVLWTRLGGPLGDTTVSAVGTEVSINGFEFVVEGVSTPAVPSAPVLAGSAGDAQVSLSWTAAAAFPEITSYAVKRWNGSSFVTIATTTATTYINTGLVNGTEYRYAVTATNSVGSSSNSNEIIRTPSAAPTGLYDTPTAPNLDTTGAIVIGTGTDLAAVVESSAEGTVFSFAAGTYTNVVNVKPKANMRFIGADEATVIFDGGGTRVRAFRGRGGTATTGVVIANITFTDYGVSGGLDQSIGVIDAKGNTNNDEGTPNKWLNARIHNCTINDCANVGIWFGDGWTVDECVFDNLHPQAIGGGYYTGGRITRNDFLNCGARGAPGSGVNYAAIKLVIGNCGPHGSGQGTETHQQIWQTGTPNPLQGAANQVTTTPATTIIDNNYFDCSTPGEGVADGKARGIWFDIDVRMFDVAYNTFDDPYVGIFGEGVNNGWVHHNTINRAGTFTPAGGRHGNIYFGHGGICMDAGTNVVIEDNTIDDSQCSIIGFLGRRDGPGADWVTDGTEYALGGYIAKNYNVIPTSYRSNLGTNTLTVRNNSLTGTSTGMGMLLSPDMNTSTETHPTTWVFTGNDYEATTGAWWWQGVKYTTEAAWQGLGFQ